MRLALFVISFPKTSETFIANKAAALIRSGLDVHIICRESKKSDWQPYLHIQHLFDGRKRIHKLWPHNPAWKALFWFPFVLAKCFLFNPPAAWKYLKRGFQVFGWKVFKQFYIDEPLISLAPDIIHFEFGAQAVGKMYLKDLLGARILVSFRGYDLNFSGLNTAGYYDEVFSKSDAIHLLGKDLWNRALVRGCPPDKPHVLIPPAVDLELFSISSEANRPRVENGDLQLKILSVGRLEWQKGYEYSMQAMRLLKEQKIPFKFRIVGHGNMIDMLGFLRHQLGLENEVELMGVMSQKEVKEQLAWADVFLHSAVSEGFCNAVLEAQSMKLPVVTADAGGLVENVENNVTGFVVPRRNGRALAEKLAVLASDKSLRMKMGEAGRTRVHEKFRLQDQITAFQSLYDSILQPLQSREAKLTPVSIHIKQ